mgnify:CR=1 FL=1
MFIKYNILIQTFKLTNMIFLVSTKRKNTFLNYLITNNNDVSLVTNFSTKFLSKLYFDTIKFFNNSFKLVFILVRIFKRLVRFNWIFFLYSWSIFTTRFYFFALKSFFFIDLIFIPRITYSYKKYKKVRSIKKKIRKKLYLKKIKKQ